MISGGDASAFVGLAAMRFSDFGPFGPGLLAQAEASGAGEA
jgi:hypothetical protein